MFPIEISRSVSCANKAQSEIIFIFSREQPYFQVLISLFDRVSSECSKVKFLFKYPNKFIGLKVLFCLICFKIKIFWKNISKITNQNLKMVLLKVVFLNWIKCVYYNSNQFFWKLLFSEIKILKWFFARGRFKIRWTGKNKVCSWICIKLRGEGDTHYAGMAYSTSHPRIIGPNTICIKTKT